MSEEKKIYIENEKLTIESYQDAVDLDTYDLTIQTKKSFDQAEQLNTNDSSSSQQNQNIQLQIAPDDE